MFRLFNSFNEVDFTNSMLHFSRFVLVLVS
uniref:Uncharacterized protein n=1 Tax=Rhizophora mucronata TaxID=61149 RepID=A0A2P2P6T1_RHIMU